MPFLRRPCARLPLVLACMLLAAWTPRARAEDGALDHAKFIGLNELKPGMKAVGKTVFTGRAIEDFELEIVGVVPGGKAEGAMILARALGPRL